MESEYSDIDVLILVTYGDITIQHVCSERESVRILTDLEHTFGLWDELEVA